VKQRDGADAFGTGGEMRGHWPDPISRSATTGTQRAASAVMSPSRAKRGRRVLVVGNGTVVLPNQTNAV
jgi:hypothetical protein